MRLSPLKTCIIVFTLATASGCNSEQATRALAGQAEATPTSQSDCIIGAVGYQNKGGPIPKATC